MITAHLDFAQYNAHFVHVNLDFTAPTDCPQLWLPTWIAGSYLLREFAKNITAVHYSIGCLVGRAEKINKNTWTLPNVKAGDNVLVSYEVYCFDLSVRTAYVDSERLFGNFTSLVLMITGLERALCQVRLEVPKVFFDRHSLAACMCGLQIDGEPTATGKTYTLAATPACELYDYPFEITSGDGFDFYVMDDDGKSIRHDFFVSGNCAVDFERLHDDLADICNTYAAWLGWLPFDDYTFMTHATGNDYGGLEHINSTALITPRTDLPYHEDSTPSANYQRFLGLCSHEYFHAWWVKSVRPNGMMDNDLQNECYTPLLWVFEGFTSYIDNFMLLMSGVINLPSYLTLLANDITRLYNTEGRHHQSVAESSMDAWIKLYRPDENSPHRTVSYYNKGTLVALCLDLLLLKHSDGQYRLLDVIKHFVNLAKHAPSKRFGMTTENLGDVLSEMMGADNWQDFYDNYVIGTTELPLVQLLQEQGIELIIGKGEPKPLALTTEQTPQGLLIKTALPTSPAVAAGLSAQDIIVAIDGLKATKASLLQLCRAKAQDGKTISCHVLRRDELLAFDIRVDETAANFCAIKASLNNPSHDMPHWLRVDI